MTPGLTRRSLLIRSTAALGWMSCGHGGLRTSHAQPARLSGAETRDLTITRMTVTPVALPDPPLLAAGGCHGPYFLRNIVQLETNDGFVGVGETHGGESIARACEAVKDRIVGHSATSYHRLSSGPNKLHRSVYAAVEVACLDLIGRATGLRLCELLGGPVRDRVEFASYLFFRYASDHEQVLSDPRLVDGRGKGGQALDEWGEVRSVESMANLAVKFRDKFGFRVHKLKAGVFSPDMELETLQAINERFNGKDQLRIDPNGRWSEPTALRIGRALKDLPLEYYEDPVAGQTAMGRVRQESGLATSTNSCVTHFDHIPDAVHNQPIDVVLGDHHVWGGLTGFQTLGRLTESLQWGLSQHSNNHAGVSMAAMIHAGAITPQLKYASDTHYVWLPEGADIVEGSNLPIKDGHMSLPSEPGLGVSIDPDKLARAHEVYVKSGLRKRNDRATMQRFAPGWKRTIL